MAQTPAAPEQAPAAAAPAESPTSPEAAAFEAKGAAFETRMKSMGSELEAVMEDEAKDAATKSSEADAIIDRYAPDMTAFAGELETFLKAESEKPENAANKEQLVTASATASAQIRNIPDQIRAGVRQAIAAEAAAPAAPAEPATPAAPQ
ncbi:hypothetical protein LTR94_026185 [Friedmanniomyces endolithicus]|nr:hypothetical protein LTR94_026185 [Friedmanniomyces endolithicus]